MTSRVFDCRLEELEKMMVGGEEAENEEIKKRHQEKIEHVEARKRRLTGAQKQQQVRC